MRGLIAKLLFSASYMAFALPAYPALAGQMPEAQATLQLTIIGPRSLHRGQKLKFKAVLTNRSSASVVVAPRDASHDFEFEWAISESSGRELREAFVGFGRPMGGPRRKTDLVRPLEDSDVAILLPGGMLVNADISTPFSFGVAGTYRITVTYTYIPPQLDRNSGTATDRFGQKYDLADLSPQTLELMKNAIALTASSTLTLIVE